MHADVLPLLLVTSGIIPPVIFSFSGADEAHTSTPPNIILMLADDMGFDDMSYRANNSVETPHLDNLAQISTRFENFYVHSLSAPTRASLLTGRHFLRTGVSGVHAGRDFMNLDETTIAEVLKSAGYNTGMWGKWHSGKTNGYYPWQRGFDEAYMASLYHHNYNNGLYKGTYEGKAYNGETLTFGKEDGVWTDAKMTDMAIDFITRNKDEKFFAYVPYLAAHEGWAAPDEYKQPYLDKGQSQNFATLNGMLSHLDHQVGRIIKTVESLGIAENTIIIFMSDNGPNYNKNLLSQSEWTARNPSAYKGSKSKNLENGIHSPLFMYWKGHTVPIDNKSVIGVCDIFPTLCQLAGATLPTDSKALDGKSFCNIINHPSICDNSRSIYISHASPFVNDDCYDYGVLTDALINNIVPEEQHIGVRKGDYKLLLNEYGENKTAFWNLAKDYKEQKNLYTTGTSAEKQMANTYKTDLISWYENIKAEQGSYTIPTFQIGAQGYQYTDILCYAPTQHSAGLTNDALQLKGFNMAGEWATYKVNVLRDGTYDFRIHLMGKSTEECAFSISSNTGENLAEAIVPNAKFNSNYCRVRLNSTMSTITIKLKTSVSKECSLKHISLEPLDE